MLSSHDAVLQSAVVGRSAGANEEVVAFVQLLKGSSVTPSELMAYVSPQLTSYKRPSQIIVLDALPATSTGKILKHKLAEIAAGDVTPHRASRQPRLNPEFYSRREKDFAET